ncbi:MAG: hypothetical protein N4A72_07480 [Bacteroidales bacterium]|jgi:hypothetical protein|nr:hypothetical protein [Bacteroidales bacterium]
MRKLVTVLLCLSVAYSLTAQESTKQREVGLVFSNLDNFGLTYKIGTNKSMWRFNTILLSGGKNTYKIEGSDKDQTEKNFGFGIKVGKEFRKKLKQKIELRFGADLLFNYSNTEKIEETKKFYESGVNLVFGLNYLISDNLVIGAEILPYMTYKKSEIDIEKQYYIGNYDTITERQKDDISEFNYGLSSSSVLLSLTYRF